MAVRGALKALRQAARTVRQDVVAARERDPAATSTAEILLCYPGLHAVWAHRTAHALYARGQRLPARLLSQASRFATGIEIHPGAQIGHGFFIDHGMGVVIGETTEIGENVTVYQGVTLGGTGKETGKRHPTVHDGVIVGTGARVLGPVDIGECAKVGAGSIVIKDVPANSTVVGNPGRTVTVEGVRVGSATRPDIDHVHLPDPVADTLTCLMDRIDHLEQAVSDLRAGRPVDETAMNGAGDCIDDAREGIAAIKNRQDTTDGAG